MSGSALSLELLNSVWFIPFMIIVVPTHVLFLHGIRNEISRFMVPWVFLFQIFMIFASVAIFVLGITGTVNIIWFGKCEITRAEVESIFIYLVFKIWGIWVEEIYKSTKKKEEAEEKKQGKKNKGGWKIQFLKKTLAYWFDLVNFLFNLNMNNGINTSVLNQNEISI